MKKLIILSIGAIALITSISSCKKGENDPALSLKSRKARLAGEWTVTKEEGTSTSTNVNSGGGATVTTVTNGTSTYDGTNYTSTSTSTTTSSMGGTPTTNSSTNTDVYTSSYTFEKDGTFKMETVHSGSSTTDMYEGTWAFLGKSKTVDLKNKEAIVLTVLKMSQVSGGVTVSETATGFDQSYVMLIDQLKSKEIIFITENSYVEANGDTSSDKTTTTLTAK